MANSCLDNGVHLNYHFYQINMIIVGIYIQSILIKLFTTEICGIFDNFLHSPKGRVPRACPWLRSFTTTTIDVLIRELASQFLIRS